MNLWGVVLVICLLALAALVLGVRWLWRSKIKRSYYFGFLTMMFPAPGRITLDLLPASSVKNNPRVSRRTAAFRALDFEPVASFSLREMSGARLHLLVHPISGLAGLVHEHSCVGTWSDVMRFSSAGEPPVLASNVLKRAHFLCLPGDPKFHHADASEAELVRIAQEARAHNGTAQRLDAASFPRICGRAYADATDELFRHLPDEKEIRRLVKELSPECEFSDDDVAGVRRHLPALIANDWRRSCLHELLADLQFPAREWQEARDRVLVIHDHSPLRELRSRSLCHCFLTPKMKQCLRQSGGQTPPRQEFETLNTALAASHRYKKIGAVERPVPADIYRAPLPGGTT